MKNTSNMKKAVMTLAMVVALGFGSFAQGRLFGNDDSKLGDRDGEDWGMSAPSRNGESGDQAPLGSGALLMVGFGAAYLAMRKRNKEE